ncbi:nuclease-related domain-containing protein [Streptomyces sp. NPDC048182]|uniref:nuclease-related domain-containing protein n=1 Tax=Streptomyces sp. NPDC048182 TaxID=3365507 RepID=UPI00371D884E
MDELKVSAWKRHGHDRLYVNRPDGSTVAWFDRKTGHIEVKVPVLREAALEALAPYLIRPSTPVTVPTGSSSDVSLPSLPPKYDLAGNPPGFSLRREIKGRSPSVFGRLIAWSLGRATDDASWRTGYAGERIVGRELKRLGRHGWRSLHSIMVTPTQDIDHLLIGPGGVFTINTKNHTGMDIWVGDNVVKVNHGPARPYLGKSRAEAARASRTLERGCGFPVAVKPLLVFVKPSSLRVERSLQDVRAIRERGLADFAPLAGVLRPDQVEAIYTVARDQRNWMDDSQR